MAEKYFSDPFAVAGDVGPLPNAAPIDGSVSYESGFGIDYELPNTDPDYLSIPRVQFNQLMLDITGAIQMLQQTGFPSWITSAANNGSPYVYAAGAQVMHSGTPFYSLVDGNTDEPPSVNWGLIQYAVQQFQPGDTMETYSSTLPDGWLWVDGKTIGNATSGATSRANGDTVNLFTVLWNSISNAVLTIQDSSGNPTTRGISASVDFAANKRMPLPDKRGKIAAAADNLGGTPAGILTGNTAQGVDGTILGNVGGEQSHSLIINEITAHVHASSSLTTNVTGNHTHDITTTGGGGFDPTHIFNGVPTTTGTSSTQNAGNHSHSITGNTDSSGGSLTHNNVQPTIIANFRIKL